MRFYEYLTALPTIEDGLEFWEFHLAAARAVQDKFGLDRSKTIKRCEDMIIQITHGFEDSGIDVVEVDNPTPE